MRNHWSLLVAASLWAASTVALSQTPAAADKAPAVKSAPARDLNTEAMKGMGPSRSSMTPEDQRKRAAEKAEKQAQRAQRNADAAKKKAEEAQRRADAAKT
jgi:hypothetical protein